MARKKLAIDLLREAEADGESVMEAVRLHMMCGCQGGGASCYYPEAPCPDCGFNCFDSLGVEAVMDDLVEREPELESIWHSGVKR